MGYSRWDSDDWKGYSASTVGKTTDAIFTTKVMKDSLNPFGTKMRESRDSDLNPNSNAIIVALDVTGSMGRIADVMAREGLGVMVEEILARKPVSDPHIMLMGVGDACYDRAPLQVTQFEADILIAEQLQDIWLEKGGGGNSVESYTLPWYYAAMHTSIDCVEKRGKKGYLFTVGDEEAPDVLLAAHIKKFIGDDVSQDMDSKSLLNMVSKMYNVFHIIVEEGSHARSYPRQVKDSWTELLGQRVLMLSDHTKLAEVVVSTIEVCEGRGTDGVVKSWGGDTSLVVSRAINSLTANTGSGGGLVRF